MKTLSSIISWESAQEKTGFPKDFERLRRMRNLSVCVYWLCSWYLYAVSNINPWPDISVSWIKAALPLCIHCFQFFSSPTPARLQGPKFDTPQNTSQNSSLGVVSTPYSTLIAIGSVRAGSSGGHGSGGVTNFGSPEVGKGFGFPFSRPRKH